MPSWPGVSNLLLSNVLLVVSPVIRSPWGLFLALAILFSYYLPIHYFYNVISVHISITKTVLFPLWPFVHLSLCILHQIIGKFSFVILYGYILFVLLDPVLVSFENILSLILFFFFFVFTYFFHLYCKSSQMLYFSVILFHFALVCFSFFSTFLCSRSFFICPSSFI